MGWKRWNGRDVGKDGRDKWGSNWELRGKRNTRGRGQVVKRGNGENRRAGWGMCNSGGGIMREGSVSCKR